jgi:hypothetical protein
MLPNGTVETRGYDSRNRLTFVENRDAAGVVISRDSSVLSPAGRRDAVIEETGRRVGYRSDALDRQPPLFLGKSLQSHPRRL